MGFITEDRLRDRVAQLENDLKDARKNADAYRLSAEDCKQRLAEEMRDHVNLCRSYNSVCGENKEMQREIASLKEKCEEAKADVDRVLNRSEATADVVNAAYDALLADKDKEISGLAEEISLLAKEIREKIDALASCQDANDDLRRAVDGLRKDNENHERQAEAFVDEHERMRRAVEKLRKENKVLEDELKSRCAEVRLKESQLASKDKKIFEQTKINEELKKGLASLQRDKEIRKSLIAESQKPKPKAIPWSTVLEPCPPRLRAEVQSILMSLVGSSHDLTYWRDHLEFMLSSRSEWTRNPYDEYSGFEDRMTEILAELFKLGTWGPKGFTLND